MPNVIYTALTSAKLLPLLAQWQAKYPAMGVFALLPEAEQQLLPVLQSACRQHNIRLLGGIFPSLLIDSGFANSGVLLFLFKQLPPAFILPDINQSKTEAGQQISQAVNNLLNNSMQTTPTLFLLIDAMLPNINSILDNLYLQLANRVRYAGINAGSETFQPMPCLFDESQIVANGVLGMLLTDPAIFHVEHGYPAPDHVMMASSSNNNCISSIDWCPAFDMYQQIIKRDYAIELTRDNFYNYAVHYPFGILRANGEVVVRIPVALTEDGSIYCVGEVPENAMLVLLRAPDLITSSCLDKITAKLPSPSSQQTLLTFYCAGRRMHLGESAITEVADLKTRSHSHTVAGALSLGEVGARESDYPIFHNAALVCAAWPDA